MKYSPIKSPKASNTHSYSNLLKLAFYSSIATLTIGCANTNQNGRVGSTLSTPYVSGQVNAHMEAGKKVVGNGSSETLQILFMKFNVGGRETNVGNVGNRVLVKETLSLNPFEFLFRSPANRQAAVDAAYYDAIENGKCDALLNTKVNIHSQGFSFLGLFGHGSATATVDAYGLEISKGIIQQTTVIPTDSESRPLLKRVLGLGQNKSNENSVTGVGGTRFLSAENIIR